MKRAFSILTQYQDPRLWLPNVLWRFPSSVSELDCIFVVGSPRSGTTLLQRVLSIHSELFSINGETGLFSYHNIFHPRRKHFNLPYPIIKKLFKESSDIVNFFDNSICHISGQEQLGRFVEKTPQHIFYIPFILKHFPKSKIIHIIRDGRDCYCSAKSHPNIPQNKSVKTFAKYWKNCLKEVIFLEDEERILTVRYEDFVSDSSMQLKYIMNFLDLIPEEEQLSPVNIGNDPRSQHKQFHKLMHSIDASSVGRYLSELTEFEIDDFEKIAKKQLAYYGYSL